MELKNIKEKYEKEALAYKLPGFRQINEDFEIEKIEHETETILRAVRKIMMEKMINLMGFIEMFINPVNVARMYLPYLKNMTSEEKAEMDKIYDSFAALSLEAIDCEIDYSDKAEAEMIRKIFDEWNSVKPKLRKIMADIKKPSTNNARRERSYYG